MHQAQIVLALDQFSAEHLRVERDASLQVLDAQHNVIDVLNRERLHEIPSCLAA
jgi:hypothetical protein